MSLSLDKLDQLVDALIKNANSLIEEAILLNNAGYYARAFALAHFAREELAKSYMLQAAAFKIQLGKKIDWKQLMKRFRAHNDKLRMDTINNAMLTDGIEGSKFETTAAHADAISKYRNNQKNLSLYVDIDEGVIAEPIEIFNKEKCDRIIILAKGSYDQQFSHKQEVGKFSERKLPKMDIPDFENMSTEELIETLKNIAPLAKTMFNAAQKK